MSKNIVIKWSITKEHIKEFLELEKDDAINNDLRTAIKWAIIDHLENEMNAIGNEIFERVKYDIDSGKITINKQRKKKKENPKCKYSECTTKIRQQKYNGYCYRCYIKFPLIINKERSELT